jgi:Stage II sporulation protein E (SpoIIE)
MTNNARLRPDENGTAGHGAEPDMSAVAGQVTSDLLRRSHVMPPESLASELERAARPLGVFSVRIYLADLQERRLTSLPGGTALGAGVLPIDSTLPGRAFQTITIQSARVRDAGPGGDQGPRYQVHVPLVDGTERLGVLTLGVADVSEAMLEHYRALAALVSILTVAKTSYADAFAQTRRDREMALGAELVWAFLPPRTFATERVLVSATLEPAYAAGGDAYDYSLLGSRLHVSIFDALGHDLSAGLLASVCIASCRATRRSGGGLAAIAARADEAIAGFFSDDQSVTALLCELDLDTGLLSWIPCGHPPPLLIRGNRTVRELARTAQPPLGLAGHYSRAGSLPASVAAPVAPYGELYTERLEPGDRVLLYTDGVTECRAADDTPFGLQRLADFIIRHSNARLPAPETMRRLNHAVLGYAGDRPRDDATAIMIEWQPSQPGRRLTPLPAPGNPRGPGVVGVGTMRRKFFHMRRKLAGH